MTPCHREKYEEALQGIASMFPRLKQIYGQDMMVQPWMRAAMEQHAHYYAAQACGEKNMDFGNSMRRQLGIPMAPTGDVLSGGTGMDRRARVMRMSGFGKRTGYSNNYIIKDTHSASAVPASQRQQQAMTYACPPGYTMLGDGTCAPLAPTTYSTTPPPGQAMHGFGAFGAVSPIVSGRICDVGDITAAHGGEGVPAYNAYCDCMYPADLAADANAICKKFNLVPSWSPVGAGQPIAPWSVLGANQVPQWAIDAASQAAQAGGKQAQQILQQGGGGGGPTATGGGGTATDGGAGTATSVGRGRSAESVIDVSKLLFPGGGQEKKDNTMLYVGIGAAALAAFFIFGKK